MKSLVRWISSLVVVLVAIPAVAGNIGFLDRDRAIKGVKEGQRQLRILDAWANERSDEVEAIRDRVVELTQQVGSQRNVASADVVARLERDLLQAQRDLEDAGRALRFDFEKKQNELLVKVALNVRTVAKEYAEANGFDAIFTIESQPLVYINDSVIITDTVIKLYNERFPLED